MAAYKASMFLLKNIDISNYNFQFSYTNCLKALSFSFEKFKCSESIFV